jgi:hypothetical protein
MALAAVSPTAGPPLNPAQQEVVDLLGSTADERPTYDPGLRNDLRAELEAGLAPVLAALPDGEDLYLAKYPLSQVHSCEARYLAGRDDPFAWTIPSARGTVAHKAIELSVHWRGQPLPMLLVDEAIARLAQGNGSLADFLQTRPEADLAELRSEATDRVSAFIECFPPLKPEWRPVTESSVRVELFDQRIVLQGKVDLTLGHARGNVAGKALIDLKTGGFSPTHTHDLRFYALVETLKLGTPPLRLASYYLDSGRPHPETVTVDLLLAAVHRTVDGARRLVELLHHEHLPIKRPSPACRWCPELATCTEGRVWIESSPYGA